MARLPLTARRGAEQYGGILGEEPTFQLHWSRAAKQKKLPLQERIRVKVPDVDAEVSPSAASQHRFLPRLEGAQTPSELAAQRAVETAEREAKALQEQLSDLQQQRRSWEGSRRLEAAKIQREAKAWHLRRDALFNDLRQVREETARLELETKQAQEALNAGAACKEDRAAELEEDLVTLAAEIAAAEAAVANEERLVNDSTLREGADEMAVERKARMEELSEQVLALEQELYKSRPHRVVTTEDADLMSHVDRAVARLEEDRRSLLTDDVAAWVRSRKEVKRLQLAESQAGENTSIDAVAAEADHQPSASEHKALGESDRPDEAIVLGSMGAQDVEEEAHAAFLQSTSDEGPASPSGMGSEATIHGEEAAGASLARGLFPPVLAQPGPESSTAFQSDGASVVSGLEQSMEELQQSGELELQQSACADLDVQHSVELECTSLEIVPGQDQALARDLVAGALAPFDTAVVKEEEEKSQPASLDMEERSRQLGLALFLARQELSGKVTPIDDEDAGQRPLDMQAFTSEVREPQAEDTGEGAMVALRLDIPEQVLSRGDRSESEHLDHASQGAVRESSESPSTSEQNINVAAHLVEARGVDGVEGVGMQDESIVDAAHEEITALEPHGATPSAGSRPASATREYKEHREQKQDELPASPGAASNYSRLEVSTRAESPLSVSKTGMSSPEPGMSRVTSNRSVAEEAMMRKLSTPPGSRPNSALLKLPSPKNMQRIQSSPARVEGPDAGPATPPEMFRPSSEITSTLHSVSANPPAGPVPRYRRAFPAVLAD